MGRVGNAWSTAARIEGAVSIATAAGLATSAVLEGDHRWAVVRLGVTALVVLVAAILLASPLAVGASTATLGLACIVGAPPGAPFYGVGLLLVAETALWSVDDRLRLTQEPGPRRDRLVLLGTVGASSIALSGLLRLLGRDAGGGGTLYSVLAGASIIALAALITIGTRRSPTRAR